LTPHRVLCQQQLGSLLLDVNITFSNEIIIISGDNGVGKTSLLRAIAGLENPSGIISMHGETWLNSQAGVALPTVKRNLAYMWSEAVLLPWLNVNDNIQLGHDHDALWLADVCSQCNINHLQHQYPAMLSTGEAQRVALARAIYRKPCLLLLDEPFSAQAPRIHHQLRVFLQTIQQQWHIPVLIVSHNHDDIKTLAQQHWHMSAGTVIGSN